MVATYMYCYHLESWFGDADLINPNLYSTYIYGHVGLSDKKNLMHSRLFSRGQKRHSASLELGLTNEPVLSQQLDSSIN